MEQEWRRLETPEALEELRKKDQETRGLQKAEAEKKLAEANQREQDACKASDPALENQAKEAAARAAELKQKAEADCKAAAECDRSLEDMGPEPEEPEGETRTLPVEIETESPPREERCREQRAAMNRAQGGFDALLGQLADAEVRVDILENVTNQLRAKVDTLEKESAKLLSEVSWWDWLWMTDDYRRSEAKERELSTAFREWVNSAQRLVELRDAAQRLERRVREAEGELRQAQTELARCMGMSLPARRGPLDTTTTTTAPEQDAGATGSIFGQRRNE